MWQALFHPLGHRVNERPPIITELMFQAVVHVRYGSWGLNHTHPAHHFGSPRTSMYGAKSCHYSNETHGLVFALEVGEEVHSPVENCL